MKVSIVIPNYNGEALLKKNLPKVLEAVEDAEVIVVDDASTDGSIEEIKNLSQRLIGLWPKKSKVKNIKLIKNNKNLGFAATVNRGVNEASGDLVILLNTDVYPEKDFLEAALLHFKDPQVFAVGFLQKCPENGKIIERGRGVGKFEKGFLIHDRGAVIGEDTSEVAEWTPRMVEESKKTLWVSGGAGIYRKKIWEELGGMGEIYSPFYWEDIDLSYRALKTGYKLIFEPKSVVEHQQETTIKSQYSQGKIKTIAYRNQILFVWLNITDWKLILQHILFLPYQLIRSLLTLDLPFIKALFRAFIFIPRVFIKRQENIKFFRLNDSEVLKNFST